ncbi:tripartite ATP-independent transporter DctM subunit [Variovorax paradoxus]|uniref:Tripartite ATP-independent transporter DctM subunit n=1 Tax=Variovorax paradoxus TaxID=34073 RepID=A0AAE3Y3H8_VARPD|nr:TRAP transporter large permease subunit [Variovorax paradoxus]MDP9965419.1 tripartite ATP-independent transporter DctM subunit [Variovorax paradoxus]MDR6428678.1 tripartite ATP-independent transporter DctM subunit [Variovorax paradoxus]MDR6455995.1 tripartite ATP-independent transporter DctM subunit [Variovorax paradoxus]
MHAASISDDNPQRGVVAAWATRAQQGLGRLLGVPVALLVAAEIAVLLAGVVARYVFHHPLIWSDEVASILFLWLAMLGSAVAFQRGEHMRMTAVVGKLDPSRRAFLDVLATTAALAFLLLILPHAWEYAVEEAMMRTPALDLQNSWRVAAMAAGFGAMALLAVLRLAAVGRPRQVAAAVGLVVAIIAVMTLLQPVWRQLGNTNLVVFFVVVVAGAVFAGVPIAFAFGLATLGYVMLTTHTPVLIVVGRMDEGVSHLVLLSVPLFVFLGQLIEMTGMARAMVAFLASLLGHVRGGLHYVLVGAMYLVSGISGSKAADMAAVAPVLFPEMTKRGAKEGDLVALLSATGAQTETIPPSIVLITIGSVTGVSIAALFTGGLLPGLVLAATLVAVVWARYRHEDLSGVRRASRTEIGRAFVIALPAIALPFIIRAAVVEGIATATEVSTIGIAYGVVAGLLIYRQFDWKRIYPMLVDTASLSGSILLIIGAATAMAWGLTQSGFSHTLSEAMRALPGGAAGFMAVSVIAFIVLGSVLEGIPAIVLFGPLLFPIARAVGIHEVHYAMVVILAMGLGLFAPPFGVGYYAACAIGRVNPDEGIRPIGAYMLALFIGLVIVAALPWISIGFL